MATLCRAKTARSRRKNHRKYHGKATGKTDVNGQQPISENCNRAGLLRLSPAGRQVVRLELRKTSALAGSSRRSGSLPISSLALSCRLRNACWGVLMVLSGCNSAPPANPGDVCSIFTERTSWYRAAKAAEERWQTPIALNMAIIYQESSFRSRARPERERFLWVFPGARPSSAFGYAQALESTWQEYQLRSGNDSASRSDFADAVDFVAWYNANSRRISGIEATDARSLYFAYHEGNAGFQRGRHLRKRWLIQAADQVQQNSEKFGRQLDGCRAEFEKSWFEKLLSSSSEQIGWKAAMRSMS